MKPTKKIPQVDIEKLIGSKNKPLLRLMPKFILNYVKRIIHQDEVNHFLQIHHTEFGLDFIAAALQEFNLHITTQGIENLPRTGGIIVASNHPLGGLDALALMQEIGKKRTDIKFLVNDLLMALENLHPVFVPINKHGRNGMETMQRITETYASENCTIIFPAGLVSRKQGGEIKDLKWQKSFITQAIKHKRDVIPVHIDLTLSNFFYTLAQLRKGLGIKSNIEMFFLVNEMYKQRNRHITISFGEPIPYTTFTKSKSELEWAQDIKEKVYNLKKTK